MLLGLKSLGASVKLFSRRRQVGGSCGRGSPSLCLSPWATSVLHSGCLCTWPPPPCPALGPFRRQLLRRSRLLAPRWAPACRPLRSLTPLAARPPPAQPVRLPPTTQPRPRPTTARGQIQGVGLRDGKLIMDVSFVGFVSPKAPSHSTSVISSPIAGLEGSVPQGPARPPSQGCSLLCCE